MSEPKRYKIQYTETAAEDMLSKADYIERVYRDSRLSLTWYNRLCNQIEKDLSVFPLKYQLYEAGDWARKGVREYIFRIDIVLYSVDEDRAAVVIHGVYTRGKNLAEDTENE